MDEDDIALWIDRAGADYDASLDRVAELGRRQRRYLDRLHKIDDPETDGIDCDTDERDLQDPDPNRRL